MDAGQERVRVVSVAVQFSESTYRRLERVATDRGMSVNRLVESALEGVRVGRPRYARILPKFEVGSREHVAAVTAMARAWGWTADEMSEHWKALTGMEEE